MEWPEIQKRLLAAAAMLKEHKAVDIGIKSSLALIPVVGGFVSEYWDRLDVHGEAQASELAAVLTKLATQEDLFERVARRLESQGNQLLEIKLSISQIVSDIETIADDTQYTRRMLEHWDAALRFGRPGKYRRRAATRPSCARPLRHTRSCWNWRPKTHACQQTLFRG